MMSIFNKDLYEKTPEGYWKKEIKTGLLFVGVFLLVELLFECIPKGEYLHLLYVILVFPILFKPARNTLAHFIHYTLLGPYMAVYVALSIYYGQWNQHHGWVSLGIFVIATVALMAWTIRDWYKFIQRQRAKIENA